MSSHFQSGRLFDRVIGREERLAIVDAEGEFTYGDLLAASEQVARRLLENRPTLDGARVAYQIPPSFDWVAVTWGIWRAGGIAVPLALTQPPPELDYLLGDSETSIVLAAPDYESSLAPLATARRTRFLAVAEVLDGLSSDVASGALPEIDPRTTAMLVYTSGTTGRPKGVEILHRNLEAQVETLLEAWGWTPDDRILEVLPLHHVHGIVNVVSCALAAGAVCEILPRFQADEVWRRLSSGRLSLFMAVPTIYVRLIRAYDEAGASRQHELSAACRELRLMVSGSAALPVPVLERWEEITGHRLLERYGMTEIGMALSNPLVGERLSGTVGRPLPGVEIQLVDEVGATIAESETPGQIEVRGPTVFERYWQRADATQEAFRDGWFQTGDMAVRDARGVYRILGRQSVDILKSGGEKVSALEIEAVLREHEAIQDCAVVGVPDPEWGQRISAAVIWVPGAPELTLDALRAWAKERLAIYKVPSRLLAVDDLPRNALGKVTKPRVIELFQG